MVFAPACAHPACTPAVPAHSLHLGNLLETERDAKMLDFKPKYLKLRKLPIPPPPKEPGPKRRREVTILHHDGRWGTQLLLSTVGVGKAAISQDIKAGQLKFKAPPAELPQQGQALHLWCEGG